jgi:hypothetical protein
MERSSAAIPEVKASFRVMGSDLSPEVISGLLGLNPDYSHRRGDPRIGKQGRQYADYAEGLWAIESCAGIGAPIGEHIAALLGKLSGRKEAIEQLKLAQLRFDILIGVLGIDGNYGFSLSDIAIGQMADLGVTLEFDLYTKDGFQ